MERIPALALLLSLAVGVAALPAVITTLAAIPPSGRHPHLTAFAVAGVLGGGLGFLWPAWSWRWGIPASASLWIYFGFVFVSLWVSRQPEWTPAADAALTLLASCGGAYAGSRLSPRSRRAHARAGAHPPC